MKFELEEYHRGITNEELIAELKQIALKLNKTALNRTDNDEHGKYGTTTYIRRFGSWFNALEKAGLEKTRTPMNLLEEELFKNLEETWIKLGLNLDDNRDMRKFKNRFLNIMLALMKTVLAHGVRL